MARISKVLGEAGASLLGHKLRTSLMALGIVIGIASLTAVICIGQGTNERIMGLVAKHGLDMLMVRPGNPKTNLVGSGAGDPSRMASSLVEADAQAIENSISNIEMVAIVQNKRGLELKYKDQSIKTRIFGVSPLWEVIRRRGILHGEGITDEDMTRAAKVMVLGYSNWKDLFGDANPVGETVYLNGDAYKVKGVFVEAGISATGEAYDERAIIPLSTASKKLFGRPWLEQIIMRVKDVTRINQTKDEVFALLRERHNVPAGAEADFFVRDALDISEVAKAQNRTLTGLLVAVSAIAMLVGGIVIMNIMLISVAERMREIGLRRALGARRGDIVRQFLIESLLIALVGGVVGILLGAAVAPALAALKEGMVSKVTWLPFAVALASCTVVAVTFGTYPARRASRVDPVSALRG